MRQGLVYEDVARHLGQRAQHHLIANALLAQAFDHAHARALGCHPDAEMSAAHRNVAAVFELAG
jgi:hypothetical protein